MSLVQLLDVRPADVVVAQRRTIEIAFFAFVGVYFYHKKVQVGKDQEKAQSEKDSHSKTLFSHTGRHDNQLFHTVSK